MHIPRTTRIRSGLTKWRNGEEINFIKIEIAFYESYHSLQERITLSKFVQIFPIDLIYGTAIFESACSRRTQK